SGGEVTVLEGVDPGEVALPDVRAPAALVHLLIAPGILGPLEAAAGRVLPLRLGGQVAPCPVAVGAGVVPADVHHGVVGEAVDAREAAPGSAPVRSPHPGPPGGAGGGAHEVLLARAE